MRQHRFDEFDLAKIFDRRSLISTGSRRGPWVFKRRLPGQTPFQPDDENVLRIVDRLKRLDGFR